METTFPADLAKIAETNGLAKTDPLASTLASFQSGLAPILEAAKKIIVTDATQVTEIKHARAARLQLKEIRLGVEKTRKAYKEDVVKRGRAIDALANHLKDQIEPEEARLQAMEDFAERAEAERKHKRLSEREVAISALGAVPAHYNLFDMPEDAFLSLVKTLEAAREHRLEEARQLEEARREIAEMEAAERERHRLENERLRQEAAIQQAAAIEQKRLSDERYAAERRRQAEELLVQQAEANARLQAERAEREAAEKKLREEAEALRIQTEEKLRQERAAAEALRRQQEAELAKKNKELADAQAAQRREREEREKAEAELKAKAAAEESRLKAAKRMAELQPDKDKLLSYFEAVLAVPAPQVADVEASDLLGTFSKHLASTVLWGKNKAKGL